jgi:hypothetical protein
MSKLTVPENFIKHVRDVVTAKNRRASTATIDSILSSISIGDLSVESFFQNKRTKYVKFKQMVSKVTEEANITINRFLSDEDL